MDQVNGAIAHQTTIRFLHAPVMLALLSMGLKLPWVMHFENEIMTPIDVCLISLKSFHYVLPSQH